MTAADHIFRGRGTTCSAAVEGTGDDFIRCGRPVVDHLVSRTLSIPVERLPRTFTQLFGQGEFWRTNDDGWVRIADMEVSHRLNTGRMLVRRASAYADRMGASALFGLGDAPDDVVDSVLHEDEDRMADPQAWIRSTALYRALVAGLAVDGRIDDEMGRQARAAWVPNPLGAAADYRLEEVPAAAGRDGERQGARDALDAMLSVLDGWVSGAKGNHEASGHRGEIDPPCWERFYKGDIRRMVADAAREIGLTEYAENIEQGK